MYTRQSTSIALQGSPSFKPNNLSISSDKSQICYVRLNDVIINDMKGNSHPLSLPKCDVNQTAFALVDGEDVVVVASSIGVQVWPMTGDKATFSYDMHEALGREDIEGHYCAGIGSSREHIAVGTSLGVLLVFSTTKSSGSKDDSNIHLIEKLSTSSTPISCVSSSSSLLLCGNDDGDIFAFNPNAGFELLYHYHGKGYSCATICQYMDVIYAGYHTGHIRVIRPNIHEMTIEITSNIRPVTGIIINPSLGIIATCSEDQYVRVWSVPDFASPAVSGLNLLFADKINNRICTGIAFLRNDKIGVALYDDDNLTVYERN